MPSADMIILVQTLSIPIIFAGLAFWFIRYQFDQNAKERKQRIKRDQANDKTASHLLEEVTRRSIDYPQQSI